ncbi:MAG: MBL fold metallo-hydrolase [Gemmatimonadetes bacterium]|nr:MBL fold metallo-hydrolase [Gemmatimonadota bacterium]
MRIVALASGSSGNAILVDSGDTRILVDCGIGPRTLKTRLAPLGIRPDEISAVVVTHEHSDHTRGIPTALSRWRWMVAGSAGTIRGLSAECRQTATVIRQQLRIGGLDIDLIPIAHDANEPTAIAITDRASGIRAGIAHDLGQPSDALIAAFRGVDLLCIEANHDAEMLRNGPYPVFLKQRVASGTGHLSNDQSAAFIDAVSTRELRAVLLLHLSAVNNSPAVACAATKRGINRRARRATLAAAIRKATSPPIGDHHDIQFALAI